MGLQTTVLLVLVYSCLSTSLVVGFILLSKDHEPLRRFNVPIRLAREMDEGAVGPSSTQKRGRSNRPVSIRVREEVDENYQVVTVNPDETILAALERSGLSELPSDCRKGNCLTCAARVETTARMESDTGLAPASAQYLDQKDLILTCSTYVYEEGLALQLGRYNEAWKLVYQSRLYEGEPEFAQSVRARAIRKEAEQNVDDWIKETKRALDS